MAFLTLPQRAAVAALVLDGVSTEEMRLALACLRDAVRPGGALFFLFNPETCDPAAARDNPTAALVGPVAYATEELEAELVGFEVIRRERFDVDTRGYFLRLP